MVRMAAITSPSVVPVDEYIARFVQGAEKPLREYVDGILSSKPMHTKKHSQVQANITKLIATQFGELFNP